MGLLFPAFLNLGSSTVLLMFFKLTSLVVMWLEPGFSVVLSRGLFGFSSALISPLFSCACCYAAESLLPLKLMILVLIAPMELS